VIEALTVSISHCGASVERGASGHLGHETTPGFPDPPPLTRQADFMAYGSATVRPYVGAVKRVALPIVFQAINAVGAPHFHRLPEPVHIGRSSFKWNTLAIFPDRDFIPPMSFKNWCQVLQAFGRLRTRERGQIRQSHAAPKLGDGLPHSSALPAKALAVGPAADSVGSGQTERCRTLLYRIPAKRPS
jgi:hypothetical protein